ncbi:hypothetical protein SCOCK_80185 [Actinacidiphila cocklensis]|uniref:Uncharacterized protein n=1 Tax=Actinacidiphila cocklensis TaxID=887465 RepID=A0A9W4DWR9_9ACTN|nr:hypothetical protein SCOCK_80185 [Actinacidiphila cocklensis]
MMHAEFFSHPADHGLRLGGAIHAYRTFAQLQRVFPRGRHRMGSSHESHLTCCHLSPHLGGTSDPYRCGVLADVGPHSVRPREVAGGR